MLLEGGERTGGHGLSTCSHTSSPPACLSVSSERTVVVRTKKPLSSYLGKDEGEARPYFEVLDLGVVDLKVREAGQAKGRDTHPSAATTLAQRMG